jgi:hypothetical protein
MSVQIGNTATCCRARRLPLPSSEEPVFAYLPQAQADLHSVISDLLVGIEPVSAMLFSRNVQEHTIERRREKHRQAALWIHN